MTIEQVTQTLLSMTEGKCEFVKDRIVLLERGHYYVQGCKNRPMSYTQAAERLLKMAPHRFRYA